MKRLRVGVSDVIQDTALTADPFGRSVTLAGDAGGGGGVPAAGLGLAVGGAVEADEAVLSPGGGPGVSDDPVVLGETLIETVTNKLNTVIQSCASCSVFGGASVEDTTVVVEEGDGGNDDGEGPSGEGGHGGHGVVAVDLGVAVEGGEELGLVGSLARKILTEVRDVGIHPLFSDAASLGDVVEGKLVGGALAAAGTTAVVRIGARVLQNVTVCYSVIIVCYSVLQCDHSVLQSVTECYSGAWTLAARRMEW